MADWFAWLKVPQLSLQSALIGGTLFVVTLVGSLAVTVAILVRLPADYFRGAEPPRPWGDQHPVLRGILVVGKNLIGVVVVVLGIILSLPGVPGQGLLTILLGMMMLDVPGRRRFEQWLVSRERVRRGINQLRARAGQPPLELDDPPQGTD